MLSAPTVTATTSGVAPWASTTVKVLSDTEAGVLPIWKVTPLCIKWESTLDDAAAAPNLVNLESYTIILSLLEKLLALRVLKSFSIS